MRTPRTTSTARIARSLITRPPSGGGYRDPAPLPAPMARSRRYAPLSRQPHRQSGRPDLNRRPHRPERCALPGCATPRRAGILGPGGQGLQEPPTAATAASTSSFDGESSSCLVPFGPLTTTAGPNAGRPRSAASLTSASIRSATAERVAGLPPRVQVEVGDRVADVVAGTRRRRCAPGPRPGCGRRDRRTATPGPARRRRSRHRRPSWSRPRRGRSSGTRTAPSPARAYSSISGSTVCSS